MRYLALASDYDGTLAEDGVVNSETIQAIARLIDTGRKLILVTGRELSDLKIVFPRLDLCTLAVVENGAVLYNPATRETRVLATRPPDRFLGALRRRGVSHMSVGDVIIATWRSYEPEVIEAITDSGLDLHTILNKDSLMILPSGINKMTGLSAALQELKLLPQNVVAVGDAENDQAFLEGCRYSVAVANATPALKKMADFVTRGARGAGVIELIDKLVENDLSESEASLIPG